MLNKEGTIYYLSNASNYVENQNTVVKLQLTLNYRLRFLKIHTK